MFAAWTKGLLILMAAAVCFSEGGTAHTPVGSATEAEKKAVEFLMREVPAWSKNNGCFSCHNNGDAARALYAASLKGYRVPASVLADTTAWVSQPSRWDQNKGDPVVSDKRLANIQFAAALVAASDAGHVSDRSALAQAARRVAADQSPDGSWKIELGDSLGSPATYGTHLATYMALRTLKRADLSGAGEAVRRADRWISQATPGSTLAAAALLLASAEDSTESLREKRQGFLRLIINAQTRDGGWGPYADSPAEPFDTAVVLLALVRWRDRPGVEDSISRGRSFLVAEQNGNGSWPATTRPRGGDSYAQLVSTTGWAMLALLKSRK